MNKMAGVVEKLLKYVLAGLMGLIVLTVSWQVFSRYILQAPSSGSEELARFFLIWIGLLGAVSCYRDGSHLSLNILTKRLSIKNQKVTNIFSHVMVFLFSFVVLVVGGVNLVLMTFDPVQTSAALGIKIGYIYTVIPLSGLFFCCFSFIEALGLVSNNTALEEVLDGN